MNSNLISKFREIQKIGTEITVPFEVTRILGPKRLSILGDQVVIGHDDCDYVTLEQGRIAVDWLVTQLGGKVKWSKI